MTGGRTHIGRAWLALVALVCAALAAPAAAHAETRFGVAEDYGKYASDSGAWYFAELRAAGLTDNRITVVQRAREPAPDADETMLLDRSLQTARALGVRVVLAVYPARLADYDPATFCPFARGIAVRWRPDEIIIGNEPNKGVPPATYVRLLASCYAQLKPLGVTVTGGALSARKTNLSTWSPITYILEMGTAYRRDRLTVPLMDTFAFHPYPNPAQVHLGVGAGYDWPNAGIPDLPRVYQAFEDAFRGTAQPTFATTLRLKAAEIAWQTTIADEHAHLYKGVENSPTVDEVTQARLYRELLTYLACDELVSDVLIFHLIDEEALGAEDGGGGWQSGLLRRDLTRRDAFGAVQSFLGEGGRCPGPTRRWRPTNGVIGVGGGLRISMRRIGYDFVRSFELVFKADEGVRWELKLVKGRHTKTLKGSRGSTTVPLPVTRVTPGAMGGAKWTLTLRALGNPARATILRGTLPRR